MYKEGDEIIVTDKESKHFEKSGTILGEKDNLGLGERRWKVSLHDLEAHRYKMTFIFQDSHLMLSKKWDRDNKLNKIL